MHAPTPSGGTAPRTFLQVLPGSPRHPPRRCSRSNEGRKGPAAALLQTQPLDEACAAARSLPTPGAAAAANVRNASVNNTHSRPLPTAELPAPNRPPGVLGRTPPTQGSLAGPQGSRTTTDRGSPAHGRGGSRPSSHQGERKERKPVGRRGIARPLGETPKESAPLLCQGRRERGLRSSRGRCAGCIPCCMQFSRGMKDNPTPDSFISGRPFPADPRLRPLAWWTPRGRR